MTISFSGDAISQLSQAFSKAYDGNVLVSLVVSDSSHTRRSRSILQAPGGTAADVSIYCYNHSENFEFTNDYFWIWRKWNMCFFEFYYINVLRY